MGQQVCFSSSFLTCAPLERTLSCVTLFSSEAVFWKPGYVRRPSPGLLSRGLSASVHCGVSASPGPSVGPSAARSPTTVTFVQFPPSVVLERGFAVDTQ